MNVQPSPDVMPISCPFCNERQLVHVRVLREPVQRGIPQMVKCLKCYKSFEVMVPGKIIAGPF
jgi:hypothetical protein